MRLTRGESRKVTVETALISTGMRWSRTDIFCYHRGNTTIPGHIDTMYLGDNVFNFIRLKAVRNNKPHVPHSLFLYAQIIARNNNNLGFLLIWLVFPDLYQLTCIWGWSFQHFDCQSESKLKWQLEKKRIGDQKKGRGTFLVVSFNSAVFLTSLVFPPLTQTVIIFDNYRAFLKTKTPKA